MTDLGSYRFFIDSPKPLLAINGGMELNGWCFDRASAEIPQVRLVIGERLYCCESGRPRPDVGAAFPDLPQAANSGFFLRTWLPLGYHSAHLEFSNDCSHWLRSAPLPLCVELAPLVAALDSSARNGGNGDPVILSGWALHPQARIAQLSMLIGNATVPCQYGIARAEVMQTFHDHSDCSRAGFCCETNVGLGASLTLRAQLESGAIVFHPFEKGGSSERDAAHDFLELLDEQRASLLSFPRVENPKVSIVIAVYDHLDVTLSCLKSILRYTDPGSYEIILIDDHSSAATARSLARIEGLHLLTNQSNRGFLLSCNEGAKIARGKYLLFLNNDTEVTRGWLDMMLGVFEKDKSAGLVGAKLVYPDGRLQEAGGIIWHDASGANFGRSDHPEKPEYNFVREVDYCSGACILIPTGLFHDLEGFDPRFAPAYYEDTDLAFKVRAAGRKVYYQPRAVVIHHEGQTGGTDTARGIKSFQVLNQTKFREKWETVLRDFPVKRPEHVRRASQRGFSKTALVVDARIPCPDQDSGSLRIVRLLEILRDLGFQVTFAPFNRQRVHPYTDRLQDSGIECLYEPFFGSFEKLISERGSEFDLIILSRAEIAANVLPICRAIVPSVPVIFDTVDLHFVRHQREAELTGEELARKRAEEFESVELTAARECDAVLVVSEEEKDVLASQAPEQTIAVVSNIHEVSRDIHGYEERRGLLFIGGFEHPPNIDAMLWFCQEIMPSILEQLPDSVLHIVGSKMPESILALASKSVIAHGYVEDVEPLFQSCLLSVAPLRFGAGVKGKINQSMSHGLPVVSTSIGVEGMYLVHEENALIADDPIDFATQVVRLHRDATLWEKLSQNGLKNIEEHFSSAVAERSFVQLLKDLAAKTGAQRGA